VLQSARIPVEPAASSGECPATELLRTDHGKAAACFNRPRPLNSSAASPLEVAGPNQGRDVPILCERADDEDDRHHDEYQQGHHDRGDKPSLHCLACGRRLPMALFLLAYQCFGCAARSRRARRQTRRISSRERRPRPEQPQAAADR
jgi:hypothetical protein